MRLLLRHENIEYKQIPCRACQADGTISPEKQRMHYTPAKLRTHHATDYHTDYQRFLRRYRDLGPCPFGCGKTFNGDELVQHVLLDTRQSDSHLLAAANAGLLKPGFHPSETKHVPAKRRFIKKHIIDPENVPKEVLIPPKNLRLPKGTAPEPAILPHGAPKFHIPTTAPITATGLWMSFPSGYRSQLEDRLQAYRTFQAEILDQSLRAAIDQGKTTEAIIAERQALCANGRLAALILVPPSTC